MSQQIAEFFARITADTQGLQKGVEDANKKLDGLSRQSQTTGGAVGGLMGKISSMVNPTTLAVGAFTALTAYLGNATAAASESAQVDAKLSAVLKATGYAAGLTAGDIDSMATSMSNLTGIDDEVIKSGAAVLATFREIGGDVFPDAMQAALDMSAVMGQDLQSSIVQIGKALNDPIAGVTALRKVGVQLTEQQEDQIKKFMESGDVMSAQQIILQELQTEFDGAADAMYEAGSGSDGLKVALGNLQEAIGERLLPSVRETNNALANLFNEMAEGLSRTDDIRAEANRLIKEGIAGNREEALSLAVTSLKMQEWRDNLDMASVKMTEYGITAQSVVQANTDMSMSTDEFNAKMDTLADILDGDLGKAQDAYNEKIAEYNAQLAEARTQEEKDTINANIAAETAAYNERARAIAFNIQQEALLNSQLPPETKISMITALGQSYGMFDEATASAIASTQSWIAAVEAGTMSEEVALQRMRDMTQHLMETGNSAQAATETMGPLAEQIFHVGKRGEGAAEGFGVMGQSAEELGSTINSDATPAVAGLKSQINGLPPTGTSWTYGFTINVNGRVPSVPGLTAGISGGEATGVCFVGGTRITLGDGSARVIQDIQAGDNVRSYNIDRGAFTIGKVTNVLIRKVSGYLNIDGLLVTNEHPIWIVNRQGFVRAGEIHVGDILLQDDGTPRAVQTVSQVDIAVDVYNLTVESDHTYFAGGVLVHNKEVFNTGGQLGSGWAVVGDMPGGAWGPYTELVTPTGYVIDAQTSKKIKDSGLLGDVMNLYFGSDVGGALGWTPISRGPRQGTSTTPPPTKKKRRHREGGASSGPSMSVPDVEIIGSPADDAAQEAVAGISAQVIGTVQAGIVGALVPTQRAAISASTQNNVLLSELNSNLRELIGKTASAVDISRAVSVENSKNS